MSVWTVKPETKQVDLIYTDDGGKQHAFWITLKKRLTSGEARMARHAGWLGLRDRQEPQPADTNGVREPAIEINWKDRTRSRLETWLVDWSLTDDEGGRLDAHSRDVLDSLNDDVFELIDDAIVAHLERMRQEKKAQSTGSVSLVKSA